MKLYAQISVDMETSDDDNLVVNIQATYSSGGQNNAQLCQSYPYPIDDIYASIRADVGDFARTNWSPDVDDTDVVIDGAINLASASDYIMMHPVSPAMPAPIT